MIRKTPAIPPAPAKAQNTAAEQAFAHS